jgi:hypothetical protein
MNSIRPKSSNNKSSINLYDAIANDDLEGMIYLYCLCTKQSLQLLNGRNIDNRRDDVHQPTDMSGERFVQYSVMFASVNSIKVEFFLSQ